MRYPLVALALALSFAAGHGGTPSAALPCADDEARAIEQSEARTDQQASGNRVVDGCAVLSESLPFDVRLDRRPAWILPDPAHRGTAWIVVSEDGSLDRVAFDAGGVSIEDEVAPPLAPGAPPVAALTGPGSTSITVRSAFDALEGAADVLPGSRMVTAPDGSSVVLTDPTDRYRHGVLGDDLEAAAFDIRAADGSRSRTTVGDRVIEGLSALLADLQGDGSGPEIVLTLSDAADGARLAAYDFSGGVVATSEPIGQGYRWLHQIGAGPTGPAGETELIALRTPHIGGIVEAYRLVGGELRRVASQAGYSSHQLGSSNLDMALLADVTADGRPEVIVPTQDLRTLAVLSRQGDGFAEIATYPLDGSLVTNVAATSDAEGRLVIAVGTGDGRLRIIR